MDFLLIFMTTIRSKNHYLNWQGYVLQTYPYNQLFDTIFVYPNRLISKNCRVIEIHLRGIVDIDFQIENSGIVI